MTILSFLGIFAGLGFGTGTGTGTDGARAAARLVLGVFLGSAVWWLALSAAAGWLGGHLQREGLRALNLSSGIVIAGFGGWQIVQWLAH